MLTVEEKRKYIKQLMLPEVGLPGQEKIKNAKVAVVGCGGLGCPVILYLASAGVGTIGIIDFDTVSISNLHRQIFFGNEDVGERKTTVIQKKLKAMHPEVIVQTHDVMLDENNVSDILKDYDVVVDGCDNFATRYTVNDVCVALKKPLVYGSILGFEAQLAVFNHNGNKNLRDIFPEPPNAEDVPDCSENGVLATVPGILGVQMANEALKLIIGKSTLKNEYLIFDLMNNNQKRISF